MCEHFIFMFRNPAQMTNYNKVKLVSRLTVNELKAIQKGFPVSLFFFTVYKPFIKFMTMLVLHRSGISTSL